MAFEVLMTPVPDLHAFVCEELQEAFGHSEEQEKVEKVDNGSQGGMNFYKKVNER